MLDWDEANIGHIAAHAIEPDEVEEALRDPNRVPAPRLSRGK